LKRRVLTYSNIVIDEIFIAYSEKVEAEGYGNSKPPPLVILSMLRGMDTITEKVEAVGYGNSEPLPLVILSMLRGKDAIAEKVEVE